MPHGARLAKPCFIVDDEPTVRMVMIEVLEDLGYAAIEAADAISGLKVLQSDVRIDLLITDVGLPGGINGRQMADAARVRRPNLKVLFITGYAENAALSNGHLLTRHACPDQAVCNGQVGCPDQRHHRGELTLMEPPAKALQTGSW